MDILRLFKKRSRLYAIELQDEKIDKEIFSLITKVEDNLKNLSAVVEKPDIVSKDSKLSELENSFLLLKSKIDSLRTDIERILSIEVQNKDFLTIHDDGYLEDKRVRLERMSQALDDIVDLITTRPTIEDLRSSLIREIYSKVSYLIDSLNVIMADDKHLMSAYEKLEAL